MPEYNPPLRNTEYIFYVSLLSATTGQMTVNPTIAAGDATARTDGGAVGNLATLPVVDPAGSVWVKVTLSAGEMNGDNIGWLLSDQTWPPEWDDVWGTIQPTEKQFDDIPTLAELAAAHGAGSWEGFTPAVIADQVWDELLAGHAIAGSAGAALTTAATATLFPSGAISFTYTVTDIGTGLPVEGCEVWFATDALFANIVWKGDTDAFGIARDVLNGLPLLDAGTYFVRVQRAGYADFDDTEVVS